MMKRKYNILVTGSGGDIGQSIGKILTKIGYNTFGLDISPNNPARFIFDNFDTFLNVKDPKYIAQLKEFISVNKIDLVIPASEAELRFFTKDKTLETNFNNVKLIMANSYSRIVGFDKIKTCNFLEKNNLLFPEIYTNAKDAIYPCIAKPRIGSGSSNIFIVSNKEEFYFISRKYKDIFFQELLNDNNGEYTSCVYRTFDKNIRHITFRRELSSGYSSFGELVSMDEIDNLLYSIAEKIDLKGSINVQFRFHKGRPVVFEINPRFSSTVLFRHLMGFRDLEWSISEALGNSIGDYKKPEIGTKFYKGYNEYVI
tara:strand:+ start:26949 stop:27887 length:939 start_codon:yes stop_codon:yes gene_type:complete